MFPHPSGGFGWRLLPGRPSVGGGFGTVGTSVEALVCDRFEAPHGFTGRVRLRRAGAPAFGLRDREEADLRLLGRLGGASALHSMRQVHGGLARVGSGRTTLAKRPACDGLVVPAPGEGAAVKTADCVPVLLHDPSSGSVAAAHAGWRGAAAGIVAETARVLAHAAGAPLSRLQAVIGPAISACCYEVGPEVVEAFAAAGRDPARIACYPAGGAARPHLDLPLDARNQLLEAGLAPDSVHTAALCTRCHPVFHSYRREGSGVGRNWGFVVARGRPSA